MSRCEPLRGRASSSRAPTEADPRQPSSRVHTGHWSLVTATLRHRPPRGTHLFIRPLRAIFTRTARARTTLLTRQGTNKARVIVSGRCYKKFTGGFVRRERVEGDTYDKD